MRVFKFQIKVVIEQVHLSVSFPCKLSVTWKRGNQKLECITQAPLDQGLANFNESLSLQTRIYVDDKNVFQEKKSSFTVFIMTSKGNKVAGVCQINLAELAAKSKEEIRESFRLEKCPDKNAKIDLKFLCTFIAEFDVDQLSQSTIGVADSDEDVQSASSKKIDFDSSKEQSGQLAFHGQISPSLEEVKQKLDFDSKQEISIIKSPQMLLTQVQQKLVQSESNQDGKKINDLNYSQDQLSNVQLEKEKQNVQSKNLYEKLQEELSLLQIQNDKLILGLSEKEKEIINLKTCEQNLININEEFEKLKLEKDSISKQLSLIQASIQSEQTNFKIQQAQSSKEIEELKIQILDQNQNEIKNQKKLSDQTTKGIEDLDQQLKIQAQKYQTDINNLKYFSDQSNLEVKNLNILNNQSQIEINNLQKKLEEFINEIAELKKNNNQAQQQDKINLEKDDIIKDLKFYNQQLLDDINRLKKKVNERNVVDDATISDISIEDKLKNQMIVYDKDQDQIKYLLNENDAQKKLIIDLQQTKSDQEVNLVKLQQIISSGEAEEQKQKKMEQKERNQHRNHTTLDHHRQSVHVIDKQSINAAERMSSHANQRQSMHDIDQEEINVQLLQSKLAQQEEEKTKLFAKLFSQYKADIDHSHNLIRDLEQQVEHLQEELKQSHMGALKGDQKQAFAQIYAQYKLELDQVHDKNADLTTNVMELTAEIKHQEKLFTKLYDQYRVDSEQAEHLIKSLEQQIAEIKPDEYSDLDLIGELSDDENDQMPEEEFTSHEVKTLQKQIYQDTKIQKKLLVKLFSSLKSDEDLGNIKSNEDNQSENQDGEVQNEMTVLQNQYWHLTENKNKLIQKMYQQYRSEFEQTDRTIEDLHKSIDVLSHKLNAKDQDHAIIIRDKDLIILKQLEEINQLIGLSTEGTTPNFSQEIDTIKPNTISKEEHTRQIAKLYNLYKKEINDAHLSVETLEKEVEQITTDLKAKEDLFEKMFTHYKSDIDIAAMELRTKEQQIDQLFQQLQSHEQSFQKSLENSPSEQLSPSSQNQKLKNYIKKMKEDKNQLFAKLYEQYKGDIEAAQQKITALEAEIIRFHHKENSKVNTPKNLSRKVSPKLSTIDSENTDIISLQNQLKTQEDEKKKLFAKLFNQYKTDIEQSKKELDILQKQYDQQTLTLKKDSEVIETLNKELKDVCVAYQKAEESHRQKVSEQQEAYDKLKNKFDDINKQMKSKLQKLGDLKTKITPRESMDSPDQKQTNDNDNKEQIKQLLIENDAQKKLINDLQKTKSDQEVNLVKLQQIISNGEAEEQKQKKTEQKERNQHRNHTTLDHHRSSMHVIEKQSINAAERMSSHANQRSMHDIDQEDINVQLLQSKLAHQEEEKTKLFAKLFSQYKADIDHSHNLIRDLEQQVEHLQEELKQSHMGTLKGDQKQAFAQIYAQYKLELDQAHDKNADLTTNVKELTAEVKHQEKLFTKLYDQYKVDSQKAQHIIKSLEQQIAEIKPDEYSDLDLIGELSDEEDDQVPEDDFTSQEIKTLQKQIYQDTKIQKKLLVKLFNSLRTDEEQGNIKSNEDSQSENQDGEVQNDMTVLQNQYWHLTENKNKVIQKMYQQYRNEFEQTDQTIEDLHKSIDVLSNKLNLKDRDYAIIIHEDEKDVIINKQLQEINQFMGLSSGTGSPKSSSDYDTNLNPNIISKEEHTRQIAKLYNLYKKEINDAHLSVEALEKEVEQITTDLKAKEDLFERMFTHYKSDIDIAAMELRTKEQQIDQLTQQLQLHQSSSFQNSTESPPTEEQSPTSQNQKLKSYIKKMKEDKNQLFAKLYEQYKGDIEAAQQKITALEAEIIRFHHKENSKVNIPKNTSRTLSPQLSTIDLENSDIISLQNQLKTQEEEKKKLFAKLFNQYKTDIEQSKKELDILQKQYDQQTQTLKKDSEVIETLNKELKDVCVSYQKAEESHRQKVSEQQEAFDKLKSQFDEINKQMKLKELALKNAENELSSLVTEISRLNLRYEDLEKQQKASIEVEQTLKQQINEITKSTHQYEMEQLNSSQLQKLLVAEQILCQQRHEAFKKLEDEFQVKEKEVLMLQRIHTYIFIQGNLKDKESSLESVNSVLSKLSQEKVVTGTLQQNVLDPKNDNSTILTESKSEGQDFSKQINDLELEICQIRADSIIKDQEITSYIHESSKQNDEIQNQQIEIMKMLENASEVQGEKEELEKMYKSLKFDKQQSQVDILDTQLSHNINLNHEQEQQIRDIQGQLVELKCKIGEVFNVAMIFGGTELVDIISQAIGLKEFK